MSERTLAIIFDMDGTLTRQNLDFDLIKSEIGLGTVPILEAMREMNPKDIARTEAILHRHEAIAADTSELQPFALEVVNTFRAAGIRVALMTRNSRRSVEVLQSRHGLEFDLIRTREDGPTKPSPEPILDICRKLSVEPTDTWSIGDYHYDITCGARAKTKTVLFVAEGCDRPSWAGEADHIIGDLRELLGLLGVGDAGIGQ